MRRTALVAVMATLCVCAAAPPASADVGGTLCSLGGWISGVVGKVCNVAQHAGSVLSAGKKLAGGHLGSAIGELTGGGVAKVAARSVGIAAVAAAVVAGAQYALEQTGKLVDSTATPRLTTPWFSAFYWRMAAVAALLTLPFLCAAAIQAMLRSDLALLVRSAFGYLPLGMLAVGIAAPVTGLLLAASDEMSAIVAAAAGHADAGILDRAALVGLIAGGSRSLFVAFFIALFTVAAAVTLWLELLIRQAAVYVIVLMLPLFFAAMVWPARRIWAIRAVELLVALILSKFAIVAVLSLGGAALGHTVVPGFQALFAGTTLVLLAAFSPWAMLRLLPLHELAGAAVGGLRPVAGRPLTAADDRAQAATDPTEDAAAESAARVLARMPRDGRGGNGGAGDVGPALARASAPEGDRMDAADADGGAAPPGASGALTASSTSAAAAASGASGAPNGDGASTSTDVMEDPREDAFGSTRRDGSLPRLFRAGSRWRALDLSAEGLRSGEPLLDEDAPAPGADLEPDPSSAIDRPPELDRQPAPERRPELDRQPAPERRPELDRQSAPERRPELDRQSAPEREPAPEPDPGPLLPRTDDPDDR